MQDFQGPGILIWVSVIYLWNTLHFLFQKRPKKEKIGQKFHFCEMGKTKSTLAKRFDLNSHTVGFCRQTQKLEPPLITSSFHRPSEREGIERQTIIYNLSLTSFQAYRHAYAFSKPYSEYVQSHFQTKMIVYSLCC